MPLNFDDVLDRVRKGHYEQPHEWSSAGPWKGVPYIGPFFAKRMEDGGFQTPADFVDQVDVWLRLVPINQRPQRLLRIMEAACQNRRANTCAARGPYHIRDYHPACFLSLLAVLHILWHPARRRRPLTRAQLVAAATTTIAWRREAAATCGCYTKAVCNTKEACKWQIPSPRDAAAGLLTQAPGGLCVPRNHGAAGFESLLGFYGQKVKVPARGSTPRAGVRYTRASGVQWREPGPLAVLAALGAPGVVGAGWPA
jgi:hypothetical protein